MKKKLLFLFIILYFFKLNTKANDFKIKGFHLDLRSQVMTMPALKTFAEELSNFKINTLVMEWEATFPYNENATLTNRYAYKPEEIRDFIAYCTQFGIDVIPLHHCFGHVEWILRHDRYRHISEDKKEVSQVCPMQEKEAVRIFTSLFKEVVAVHPSQYFHIGGDETYLLGSCEKCRGKAACKSKSQLFVDYVKAMCKIVTEFGKTPVVWADIILKYPEAIAEMPKKVVYVDWNYGWQINHFGDVAKLYAAGATIWGAPSIRSSPDNLYLTSWATHFDNQRDFIPYARQTCYEGIVMTSWSTSGLYSFLYNNGWEIQDMEQIRNVYPLNGFRILLAAYAQSVNQTEPLNPHDFVVEYAQNRFGLTAQTGEILWEILSAKQEVIHAKTAVNPVLRQTLQLRNKLYDLKPTKNKTEFEHLKLMFDIRINYLKFKELESFYQSGCFHRSEAKGLLQKIDQLLAEEKKLDKRFVSLQSGFLHPKEIEHQNTIRKRKILVVRDFLATQIK
jgi:hypothetical protein